MDLEISEQALLGLQQLYSTISPEVSKKVIYNSVKQALTTKPYIPYKQDLYASCPDRIKQAEVCVLVLFFQAVRKSASIEDVRSYLTGKSVKNELIDELVVTYKLHKDEFRQKSLTFAPNFLPYVNDVAWRLDCDVASSSLSKPGDINYKIQFLGTNSSSKEEVVTEFTCNPEELQALINKLKEIERSCRRVASNKI
ncbi:COMM domain-containing protein 3 [Culicoides brevitarsis]|uniref:COMM domain-containing protein 3 n=1 Tax=Culicoides brevitarsis TaxID=469753 RepID=UPI00307B80A3